MNDNARTWLNALRSGEFKQTQRQLRTTVGYCCLGVACELYRRETGQGEWEGSRFILPEGNHTIASHTGLLPQVQQWLGLAPAIASVDPASEVRFLKHGSAIGSSTCLTQLNDHQGLDFNEIADVIEENADRIFAEVE